MSPLEMLWPVKQVAYAFAPMVSVELPQPQRPTVLRGLVFIDT